MTKISVKERRAHIRYAAEIDLHGTPEEGGVVARMVASNLSLGGLYCTSPSDFPEMTRLAVRMMLPLNHGSNELAPVDAEAVIVRREELPPGTGSQRYRFALFFTKIDAEGKQLIALFLESREPLVN